MYRINISRCKRPCRGISFNITENQFHKLIDLFEPEIKKDIASSVGRESRYPLEQFFNEEVG